MEFLNNIAAQVFAIPQIASIIESNAILRIATKQYGGPLLGLTVMFIALVLVLLISQLGKKSKKPKPVREKKVKPQKAPRQKAKRAPKVKGPNKAILAKLAKLPPSKLPLYPVADKRKSLEEAMTASAATAAPIVETPPQAVVDEASLIAGLDHSPEPIDVAPAAPEAEVPSFSIDENMASSLMAEPVEVDEDFDMPVAPSVEPTLTAGDDDDFEVNLPDYEDDEDDEEDFDMPSMDMDSGSERGVGNSEGQTIDPVPTLDFDPIEPLPPEEKSSEDDGEAIDIPVGSFGSGDGELSGAAQDKLAELNERGAT